MPFFKLIKGLAMGLTAMALATSVLAQADSALAKGEIRKVDKAAGKVTIRHGDIPSIEMPPMTMVFTVKDPAVLATAQTGDKIRFEVVKEDGKFVVTRIEADK